GRRPRARRVIVRASFPILALDLLPGMFVHALVDSGRRDGVYLVPNQALMLGNERSTVYVVDAQNRVEARRVVNERMVENQWLVSEGLQGGDRIIVEGRQKVRPGAEVKIAETRSSTADGVTDPAAAAPQQ